MGYIWLKDESYINNNTGYTFISAFSDGNRSGFWQLERFFYLYGAMGQLSDL